MPTVTCPQCYRELEVRFELLGRYVECPMCRCRFTPAGEGETVAPGPGATPIPLPPQPGQQPAPVPLPRESPAGMKIVLSIEGTDGAGKSSLVRFMKRLCEDYAQGFTLVGRGGAHAEPVVTRITNMLRNERKVLTPQADFHFRIAREYQRAQIAASAPAGIVVLDRFVLSVLGLVRINSPDVEALFGTFKDIVARAHLHATIFVRCPFETAWERVQSRNQELSVRETRGKSFIRRLAAILEEEFQRGHLTGQQWPVDNSGTLSAAEAELEGYLLPYLRDS